MPSWKKIGLGAVLVLGVAAIGVFTVAPGIVEDGQNRMIAHDPWPVSPEAKALHARLDIADWHADSLLWHRDLTKRSSRGHVDLPRLTEGNVAVQVFTAVTKSPAGLNYDQNSAETWDNITSLALVQRWPSATWTSLYARAIHQAERLHGFEAADPAALAIVRDRAGLEAVLARREAGEEVTAGILGIEGMHALDGDLANLDGLWDAGYRTFGLTHFFDNKLGGSLHGEANGGLSDFGRQVVQAVLAKGGIIDVAHASPRMVRDVLEMGVAPVILSHGGVHVHCPRKRNIDDALMVMIAETGGVIGMGYWEEAACGASPAEIVAAMDAAIALMGEDHVSLGSDYDGAVEVAFDTSELAALTHEMLALGWSEERIAKVMGGNQIRVLREALPQ
ncbi:dipeptidase [Rhodovulum sp. DZ06]|uniref:dipeptidase n=1 Tax=Rhodovulum sp. DZ06 TaxID=3425126 RepID=UPI003D338087